MIDYSLLVTQNPWWQNRDLIDEDSHIQEFSGSAVRYWPKSILDLPLKKGATNVVYGPRQTGKTTALKLLIKSLLAKQISPERILYFNCDVLDSKKDVVDLISSFFEGIRTSPDKIPPNFLFLDEISSVTDWPYAIKWLADAGLLKNSKIILSGSSSISFKKSGEFLPGRRKGGKDIRFLPITFLDYFNLLFPKLSLKKPISSFSELKILEKRFKRRGINLNQIYRDFLLTGGFLKMINLFVRRNSFFEAVELYKNTLKSELAKFGKREIYARRVLDKIIGSLTSETSYTNVAEEAELGSKNTAADYLGFFGDSFFLTEALFYSIPQKRAVVKKNKKYYPVDPFLFWVFNCFVTGSNQVEEFYRRYLQPPLDSRITEAFVASELYKQGLEFYFFKNSRELDFYIPKENLGVEVKYTLRVVSADLKGLKYAKRKILVSKDLLEERGGIFIIPVFLFGLIDLKRFAR